MSYEAERAIAKAALAEPGEWYTPADDDEDEIIRILSRVDLAHIATFNPEFCLGLLDLAEKAKRYEKALQNIVLADVALSVDGQRVTWPIDEARDALNPTEAKDDRCCQHTLAIHGKDGCLSSGCPCSRLREASDG